MEIWQRFAVALAIGLLVGLERGWHERQAQEGTRVAGLRTFALISVLGALWSELAVELGTLLLGFAFLGLVLLLITGHVVHARSQGREFGITTEVAGLITFALGALALRPGFTTLAAAVAVIVTLLLGSKPILHRWIQRLEEQELFAVLKLLLISVVLLPVLPNQGYGPGGALNPYTLWWLVVLIVSISFVGYFAIKIAGPNIGLGLTALFGGVTSSTATTLSFSRIGALKPALHPLLAAGVVVAATTMFPRMLLEVSVVNPALVAPLLLPLSVTALVGYAAVALLWFQGTRSSAKTEDLQLNNPFELGAALKLGAFLAAVMLLGEMAQRWAGAAGIYLLAAASGLSDVDAITLSLARMARDGLAEEIAVRGIFLAAAVNTMMKGAMVIAIVGGSMARRVSLALAIALLSGVATLLLLPAAPPG